MLKIQEELKKGKTAIRAASATEQTVAGEIETHYRVNPERFKPTTL